MRNISIPTSGKANTRLGTEPIVVLRVQWGTGTKYYATKPLTFNSCECVPQLQSLSNVSYNTQSDFVGGFSTCDVTINDDGGLLKSKFNRNILENTKATVYMYFAGTTASPYPAGDAIVLLSGKILGNASWVEGDRLLTFSIESIVSDAVIGFFFKSMQDSEDIYIEPTCIGKAWPICFGNVYKSKALQIQDSHIGKLISREIGTKTYNYITSQAARIPFDIRNEDLWQTLLKPESISIIIQGIRYVGMFNMPTSTFNVTEPNAKFNATTYHPADRAGDKDPFKMFLPEVEEVLQNVEKKFVYIQDADGNKYMNYCRSQIGNEATFVRPWAKARGVLHEDAGDNNIIILPNATFTVLEVRGWCSEDWEADMYLYFQDENKIAGWEFSLEGYPENQYRYLYATHKLNKAVPMRIKTGAEIHLDIPDIYISNLIPSSKIMAVRGRREKDGDLEYIPSRYYTVKLNEEYIEGQNSTGIEFNTPLMARADEDWEKEIYVSLTSTVGPNSVEIINWLIETYTDFTINNSTNHSVTGTTYRAVAPYPANFVVADKKNVLEFCRDISFQSRCAFVLDNNEVSSVYLSKSPGLGTWTIPESEIALKTLALSFTSIDRIVTVSNWKWTSTVKISTKKDEKDEKDSDTIEQTYTYSANTEIFGTIEKDFNIYIYNTEREVKKTALFWGYRLANIWRTATLNTFFNNIQLEIFDRARITTSQLSTLAIVGEINDISLALEKPSINMHFTLASKSGESSMSGEPVRDDDFWLGDPDYGQTVWYSLNGVEVIAIHENARVEPDDETPYDWSDKYKDKYDTAAAGKIIEVYEDKKWIDEQFWISIAAEVSPLAREAIRYELARRIQTGTPLEDLQSTFKNNPYILRQLNSLD